MSLADLASASAVRKVLRVVQNATAYDEWRIVDRVTDRNAGTITLTCASMRSSDFSEGALISRTDADGVISYDFESVGLTPTEHINTWVLPALAAAGFGWITLGTITPTAKLDMVFSWDTPLAVLLRIAAATKMELDIRRNGITGYLIDLVPEVNSSAVQADIRFDKNMVNVIRDEDTVEMVTRVFPKGAADSDGNHATMARAEWEVGLLGLGNTVAIVDPNGGAGPIMFDDQLNGFYLRKIDGTLVQVTDSFVDTPAQTIIVASTAGITVGDLIQFRADSSGTDLTSLTNPVTVDPDLYGEKVGVLDLPDISGAKNVIPNPFMRDWTGSLPAGWTAVGSPTLTHQTAAPYTVLGEGSIKVQSTADGQGVKSPAGLVFPTAENPFASFYARIWVVSGSVRSELVITTPTGTVIAPLPSEGVATNSIRNQWEVGLGSKGAADLFALGATAVAVRVVQHGTAAAVFYVDAVQATEKSYHEELIEGSGGTLLWQGANEMLRTRSIPIVSYSVPLVDLEALDPVLWAESALVPGGPVRIRDDVLGFDFVSRILEVRRDYEDPGKTAIIISNKYDDVTDLLAARPTPKRKLLPPPRDPTPIPYLPGFVNIPLDPTGDPSLPYDSGRDYQPGDLATDGGITWLSIAPSTGVTPVEGASWTQVGGGSHASTHENAGADEIDVTGLSGVLAEPQIADVIVEASGPDALAVDAIADGDYLRRSGSTIVGDTPPGGGGAVSYLGYNTVGGTGETYTNGRQYMKKITVPGNGIIVSISIYLQVASLQQLTINAGLLTDIAGSPGILISANAMDANVALAFAATTPRWFTMAIGEAVTAGDYWIAFGSSAGGGTRTIYYDGSGTDRWVDGGGVDIRDATIAATSTDSRKYSLRAAFLPTA